ncbi:MAG: YerC/YecD family TrpR-related protein [Dethiobacter sp.]
MDVLFRAILLLEKEEECYRFFEDIATISELKALAQRFQVARMLHNGKTYQQIEGETGASTATISRVKRYLQYGAGGYSLVLSRLDQKR